MQINELSAQEIATAIAGRNLRPSEVMAACLDRIAAVNPAINAVVSLRDRDALMAEARALDDAPPNGALFGLPVAIKDLAPTKGIRTTWGSPIHAGHVPAADALMVARIKAAGAIVIGKTNTPEWGHGSHTFNPVFGATRNPYDLARTPGGSSGGAAAALAARMLPLADGSDMMGSLRNPAAFCNVYGFRPSWGLVPGDAGGESFLSTMATEGPMARSVQDLARLLGVISGPNPQMPFGLPARDFLTEVEAAPADLRGKRIAWLGDWDGAYPCEPGILEACAGGLDVLRGLGAEVVPLAAPYPAEKLWQTWITLRAMLNYGAKKLLWDDPAKRALLKPESAWEISTGASLSAEAVYEASTIRSKWYARAHRLFQGYDAWVMPTAQVWPFAVGERWPQAINGRAMDSYHRWMEVVVPVSLIGLPALNVPVGFGASGLPMGMQIIGAHGQDAAVLAMGETYHRATLWPQKHPPVIAPAGGHPDEARSEQGR
ncbi:amidase [Paracoccus cavernae]|uniref:amidase n=1 Tax=Paracoccus cavernae TaxID=1571207 RepID=UPI0035F40B8F